MAGPDQMTQAHGTYALGLKSRGVDGWAGVQALEPTHMDPTW